MTWFSGKRPTFHPSAVNPKSFPGDSQGNPWCTLISAETCHNQYLLNTVSKKARPISAQAHHYYQMGCSETGLVLKVASGPWGLEEEERKMEIGREKQNRVHTDFVHGKNKYKRRTDIHRKNLQVFSEQHLSTPQFVWACFSPLGVWCLCSSRL